MERHSTTEYWDSVAERGSMAAVLDPSDRRGLKNLYIDLIEQILLEEVLDIDDVVLLDFGCGPGRFLPLTMGRARRVVGLDVSRNLLRYASALPGSPGRELVRFDGRKLPFAEACFDAVLSVGTLQCLAEDGHFRSVIAQIARCLKAGGNICLIEQVRVKQRAYQRTADEYRDAFSASGCSCVDSYPIRSAPSLVLYAIRYGLVPRRWLPHLARREMEMTRRRRPAPWVSYQEHFFHFRK